VASAYSCPVDQVQRLARAFLALPQNERDDFLRKIEVASLRWRDPAPDQAANLHLDRDEDDDWPAT